MLGAHFLRGGHGVLVLVAVALLGFLFVRRRWAARTVQVALVLGALEWVRTTLELTGARMSTGEPFVRMVVILGVVALVCGLSALVFLSPRVRRWFRLDPPAGEPG